MQGELPSSCPASVVSWGYLAVHFVKQDAELDERAQTLNQKQAVLAVEEKEQWCSPSTLCTGSRAI